MSSTKNDILCGDIGMGAHVSPLHYCFMEANPREAKDTTLSLHRQSYLRYMHIIYNIMCVHKQSLFYSLDVRINEGLIAKDIRHAGH